MKVIKPQRLALLTRPYEFEGKFYLAINTMVFFAFEQPQRLLAEVAMWKFSAEALGKDGVFDLGLPKQRGEFLVYGSCFAPGGRPVTGMPVRVSVKGRTKTLYVQGDRQWQQRAGIWSASEPVPFVSMAMRYENAFGGADFPRNPVGKGMPAKDEGGLQSLPNIESDSAPVVFRDDRPDPAGFGPLDFTWSQRYSKVGTYDDAWLKTRFPGFASDMDWSIFNAAPQDQWLPGFFEGGEPFEIEGMHPSKPLVRGALPDCVIRCFVTLQKDGQDAFTEISTRAETAFLFPYSERGIFLFRGVIEIGTADGSDIAHIVVGAESPATPKPASHYKSVLDIRLDRRDGAMHALNDAPLLPIMPESVTESDGAEEREMLELVESKGLLRANQRRRGQKILDDGKVRIAKVRAELLENSQKYSLPPPDLTDFDRALAIELPDQPVVPRLEELPAFKAEMDKVHAQAMRDALAKKDEAEALLRKACADNKLDYEQIVATARKESSGPPKPIAEKTMRKLNDTKAQLARENIISPELDRQLANPELGPNLALADEKMVDSYREFGHFYTPALAMEAVDSARLRAEILPPAGGSGNFSGRDMTGVDLSGLNLTGFDFSGCFLEGSNFSASILTNANFSKAVLARANFSGAVLRGVNLAGGNLGFAELSGSDLSGADLSGAVLSGADLRGAQLSGANLAGCDLMNARLAGADMSGVSAVGAKFIEVNFDAGKKDAFDGGMPEMDVSRLRLAGADLTKAMFLQCRMDNADFSGAKMDQAIFLSAAGRGVNFSGAKLTNLRVVQKSRLEHSNFSGADLTGANLRGTDLTASVFHRATLEQADLSEALLADADMKGIKATGLRINKAVATNADFSGANLRQASLQNADIGNALFLNANLFGADLLRVRKNANTVFEGANLKKTLMKGEAT